jgi:hypothetical protein
MSDRPSFCSRVILGTNEPQLGGLPYHLGVVEHFPNNSVSDANAETSPTRTIDINPFQPDGVDASALAMEALYVRSGWFTRPFPFHGMFEP